MSIDVNKIVAWEEGEMTHEEEIAFFQDLVHTGAVWGLQGMYGRRAMQLIEAGEVHR